MTWRIVAVGTVVWSDASAEGFDQRLVAAVADMEPGLYALVFAVAYILGLAAFGSGLFRMMRMSQDRTRGPSGTGTVLCFAIGTVMFSFPSWLESGGLTLFGSGERVRTLSYGGADAERYDALLAALFASVQFVGVVAFLKGWFVLRAASDKFGRATMASGIWHIIGGLLAWHIVPVLAAVQRTVGVELLRAG